MTDMTSRIQNIVEEISGNEALLEMLDTDAATELLNWGIATATSLVKKTENLDDAAAEQVLAPQLKAVRQTMRSIGNWAAGKYADPAARLALRDKVDGYLKTILGETETMLPSGGLDDLLRQVDDQANTPVRLIQNFKRFSEEL